MSAAGQLVRETRIARTTGTTVEVVDADHPDCTDFQSDEGGRWVTVCKDHGQFVQHDTWKIARRFLGHPEEWCGKCTEVLEENGGPVGYRTGAAHQSWTESPSYWTVHHWLNREYEKTACEECGSTKSLDWAFIGEPGDWGRDRSQYRVLCRSCHVTEDKSRARNSFSEEERARAAQTRRKKAEERRAAHDAEEERKRAAAAIDDQWSDWVIGQPMIESVYVGDEKERHQKAHDEMQEAKGKAATAKRAHRSAEEAIENVTGLKIKSKREEKNLKRLEGEATVLDGEVVAQEDRTRLAEAEKTRLARIAYVRGTLRAGWKLRLDPPTLSKDGEALLIPGDYLETEDYAQAKGGRRPDE